MDPFSYAMGLIAAQSVQREFDQLEPHRRSVSKARAARPSRVRRLAKLLSTRRGAAPAAEHV